MLLDMYCVFIVLLLLLFKVYSVIVYNLESVNKLFIIYIFYIPFTGKFDYNIYGDLLSFYLGFVQSVKYHHVRHAPNRGKILG